jgi:plastocyanin
LIASTAAALAAASLGLAACGSSSSSSNNASTSTATESTAPATTTPATTAPATTAPATSTAKATPAPAPAKANPPVKVQASPTALAYQEKTLTTKAGENTFDFTNPSAIPHDFAIKDSSGKELGATKVITKSSDTLKINLKPGTYEFYCTVPGHEQAGMKGTLTVK